MPVTIQVPEVLRRYAPTGSDAVEGVCVVAGADVRTALDELFAVHPELRTRVVRPDGTPWPYLLLFRNDRELSRAGLLDTPLADGDTLEIVGAAEGG